MLTNGSIVTAIVRSEAQLPAEAKGNKRLATIVAPNGHLGPEGP